MPLAKYIEGVDDYRPIPNHQLDALRELAKQGIVSAESLVKDAEGQVPLPHIKSDNDYVDDIERVIPADKLLELGTDNVRQLIEMLREKDQHAALAIERWQHNEAYLEVFKDELEGLRALARDLAEHVEKHKVDGGDVLSADFSQGLLYSILKCGEELLVKDYAQQLLDKSKSLREGEVADPPETFSLVETGSLHVFQAKVGLVAKQEATRQGLDYCGCNILRNDRTASFDVHLSFEARPGQQLDRVRLKQLLDRHKPVGMNIDMRANVRVKVPL